MDINTIMSVLGMASGFIGIVSFIMSRTDKNVKENSDEQYKWGVFETKLDNVMKSVEKILARLDDYDSKFNKYDLIIKEQVTEAIEQHIKEYHKRSV